MIFLLHRSTSAVDEEDGPRPHFALHLLRTSISVGSVWGNPPASLCQAQDLLPVAVEVVGLPFSGLYAIALDPIKACGIRDLSPFVTDAILHTQPFASAKILLLISELLWS